MKQLRIYTNMRNYEIDEVIKYNMFDYYLKNFAPSYDHIQLCFQHGNYEILKWLDENKFKCLHISIDNLAKYGQLKAIQTIVENHPGITCSSAAIDNAAENGHLNCIEWFSLNMTELWSSYDKNIAIASSIRKNHLDVLKWFFESYPNQIVRNIRRSLYDAIRHHHILTVKWLLENKSELIDRDDEEMDTTILDEIAETGNLDLFKWAELTCPYLKCSPKAMSLAAKNNHFHIIRYINSNREEYKISTYSSSNDDDLTLAYAVRNGNIELATWLVINRKELCKTSYNFFNDAAEYGHIHMLDWLQETGKKYFFYHHRISERAIHNICKDGRSDVLNWVKENHLATLQAVDFKTAVLNAIEGGDIQMVKLLFDNIHAVRDIEKDENFREDMMLCALKYEKFDIYQVVSSYITQKRLCGMIEEFDKNSNAIRWLFVTSIQNKLIQRIVNDKINSGQIKHSDFYDDIYSDFREFYDYPISSLSV